MTIIGNIASPDNAHIKYVRSLEKKRVRYREKQYYLEGLRLVAHALQRGIQPAFVFCTEAFTHDPRGAELVAQLDQTNTPTWIVAPAVMDTISDTVTPQGILAVVPMPDPSPALARQADLLLVLDGIRDPGNLGTILRTAQATGVQAVLLSKGSVDPYAPKVVRAGMGAHLDLSLLPAMEWADIIPLIADKQRVLADAEGPVTLWDVDWRPPTALIVGGEAEGASPEAWEATQLVARLPMQGAAESLNAAVATAIFLFEAQRQRQQAHPQA